MIKTLEDRKLEYLQEIQAKFTPRKKKFWGSGVTYHTVLEIGHQSKAKPNPGGMYEFRLEKPILLLVILLVFVLLSILSSEENLWFAWSVFMLIIAVVVLRGFIDRRIKLSLDLTGIHFDHGKSVITWEDLVSVYLKIIPDDSDTHELIIHYYDQSVDQFCEKVLNIDGLDAKYEDVCFSIAYIQLQNQQQATLSKGNGTESPI